MRKNNDRIRAALRCHPEHRRRGRVAAHTGRPQLRGGLLVLGLFLASFHAQAWGFWPHKYINRMAVFTLPPEMFGFYKAHIELLTDLATKPDVRRVAVPGEAERHFIDLDRYGKHPYPDMPRYWKDAVAKYSEDSLRAHGIAPWNLEWQVRNLAEAFRSGNADRIIRLSSDLGHYVADCHVPLHTTHNYDGQLTGQKGLHGLWETRIPELYAEARYDLLTDRATYIKDVNALAWTALLESNLAVDSVLRMEREVSAFIPDDRKYGYENRNNLIIRVYSREFCEAYHTRLNHMQERRMRLAVYRFGCLLLTAWMDAGRPNLGALMPVATVPDSATVSSAPLRIQDREQDSLNEGENSPKGQEPPRQEMKKQEE